jgi:uncharacterized repeat protein (TIGR02059 family)
MTNILKPNFFGIATQQTPGWTVPSAMVARVFDKTGAQTITISRGGMLDVEGAIGANIFQFEGLALQDVSYFRSSSEILVRWNLTGDTILSVPIQVGTAQSFSFSDVPVPLLRDGSSYTLGTSTISEDITKPTLQSASLVGAKISLKFSEELSAASLPLPSSFVVKINDVVQSGYQVSGTDGRNLIVTLASAPSSGADVKIAYVFPNSSARNLQDVAGNVVQTFSDFSVGGGEIDTAAPVALAASSSRSGTRISLEFSEPLSSDTAPASAFVLTASGARVNISSVTVNANIVELNLSSAIQAGQPLLLSYADPSSANDANAVQDMLGNDTASFSSFLVINQVPASSFTSAGFTNILRPNFFGIATQQTPEWTVPSGMSARVFDKTGAQTITIARGGKLDVEGAIGANVFQFEGVALQDVSYFRSSSEVMVRWKQTGETILSVPIQVDTAQTFVFSDISLPLVRTGSSYTLGTNAIVEDATKPTLQGAALVGTRLSLIFSEELSAAALPLPSSINIKVNGVLQTGHAISGVEVNKLVVTLGSAPAASDVIDVAYVFPNSSSRNLQDVAGNVVQTFSDTRVATDTTPPTIDLSKSMPSDNALSVPLDSNLTLVFNETIRLGVSGSIKLARSDGGIVESFSVSNPTSARLSVSSDRIIIDPTNQLTPGSSYHLLVDQGAVLDTVGNAFAGISDPAVLNFTAQGLTVSTAILLAPGNSTVSGFAVPESTVNISKVGAEALIGTATSDSQGKWSFVVPTTGGSSVPVGLNDLRFVSGGYSVTKSFVVNSDSWTADAIKTLAIRSEIDLALANGSIDHAEAVKIISTAISAVPNSATPSAPVTDAILSDLRAIAARGGSIFSSPDLNGKESGYLAYVFDKVVNSSPANSSFTGGDATVESLGNLNAKSPVSALALLRDKWLLGGDLPNPVTEGDSANPSATAASGVYRAFTGPLIDSSGFNAFDVEQGTAGTCYLLASIAAIAEAESVAKTKPLGTSLDVYRGALESLFASNATHTDGTSTWGVRFYDQLGKPHWVTVNNKLVVANANAAQPSYAKLSSSGELWVPLLEKAYAQANELEIFGRQKSINSFLAIEGGLAEPMAFMLGGAVSYYSAKNELYKPNFFGTGLADASRLNALKSEVNGGESLFIGSWQEVTSNNKLTFVSGHAFAAFDNDRASGTNSSVQVFNPWGTGAPHYESPFLADLGSLYNNQNLLVVFHTPDVPAWVSQYFGQKGVAKATSAAAPSSVSAALGQSIEAAKVRNSPMSAEGYAISVDDASDTILYVDGLGSHWHIGEAGKVDERSDYLPLYFAADGDGIANDPINNDSFEVSALHARTIREGDTSIGADTRYEVIAQSNEFPDVFFSLRFNAARQLVSSDYLDDTELLATENLISYDLNDNGGVGDFESFLAEGMLGAPDLYLNSANDMVLVGGSSRINLMFGTSPLSWWDIEEDGEVLAVIPDPDGPSGQYLLVLALDGEGLYAATVEANGALRLRDGAFELTELSDQQVSILEDDLGFSLDDDGGVDLLTEVKGDADDNFFNLEDRGGDILFVDTPGDDIYIAGEGDDTLLGMLDSETGSVARGGNIFAGGVGDDFFVGIGFGNPGAGGLSDQFFGGAGTDVALLQRAKANVSILPASGEQVKTARAIDENVQKGFVVMELDNGSPTGRSFAVWDVEKLMFQTSSATEELNLLSLSY